MKNSFLLSGALAVVCGVGLPITSSRVLAASAAVPNAETDSVAGRLPVDLARGSLGARLQVRAPKDGGFSLDGANRSAQALISDDASLSYPLAAGDTSMILSLRKADVLSRMNFINYGAEGNLTISASSTKLPFESTDWRPVAKSQKFNGSSVVGCDLGSLEARYLKIDFHTQAAGRISGLGVFGLVTINSLDPHPASVYTVSANPGVNTTAGSQGGDVYFDYANLNTGAKVVGVSHGGNVGRAQAILDGNVETNYAFDPTDPSPTVVIDLGARRSLSRLSCVYQAPAGRLDFYLVDNPYSSDYQRSANLSYVSSPSDQPVDNGTADYRRTALAERKAISSIDTTSQPGVSRASAEVVGASGRFLIAEFHPVATTKRGDFKDFKDKPDFKDTARDFKDFKDVPAVADNATEGEPLRLISLSAFSDNPTSDSISRIPNTLPPTLLPPPNGSTAQPPVNPPSSGTTVTSF